jgi:hypothetical protein
MLTDVSSLIPGTLSPGKYRVRLVYASGRSRYHWAKPFDAAYRNPTPAEESLLSSLAPDRGKFPNWSDWTITRPRQPMETGEITAKNPLALDLILRRLFYGPEPLDRVNPTILDVLANDELYEPEVKALKAELYLARGDKDQYQQLRAEILRDTPGLAWWMRMLDQGGGFLKSFRMEPNGHQTLR